jgi:radical SAM superfamily enzyme YgiQ (UPF0313 family)
MRFNGMDQKKLDEMLDHMKPDLVGITSMTSNFPAAEYIAKFVKLRCPESLVVMGGVHATFMHREILAETPEADIIVRYEGEFTMAELAATLENGRSLKEVNGISFRDEGRIISNPDRERIEDLDCLPFPAHHLLEPKIKKYFMYTSPPVLTTRGCPFSCIYCSTMAFHGRKYRTRSVTNVVLELEYLIDHYKVDKVSFIDDNFTMQPIRVFALCQEMKKRGLSIKWGCNARVDQVNEEILKVMKEAGCRDVFCGIESVSQRALDIVKKGYRVQQARDAVKMAEKLGIRTHCSFVLGLPGESKQTLKRMVQFVDETKPSGRALPNLLKIFPGTELSKRKEEYFSNYKPIGFADITKTQLDMFTKFLKVNYGTESLFRVEPPNIVVE